MRRSLRFSYWVVLLILLQSTLPVISWGMHSLNSYLIRNLRANLGMGALGVAASVKLTPAEPLVQSGLPAPSAYVYSIGGANYLDVPGVAAAYGVTCNRVDGGFGSTRNNLYGNYSPTGLNNFADGGVVNGGRYTYEVFFYRLGGPGEPPTVSGPSSRFTIQTGVTSQVPLWVRACPSEDPCPQFSPALGGSNVSMAMHGTDADPVNLADGAESYEPGPEIIAYNKVGPPAVMSMAFRTAQSLVGGSSAGLSEGWSHNYDVTATADPTLGAWGNVTLVYPYGAREEFTPVLSGGNPTGAFTAASGTPIIVTGSPKTTVGQWNWVRLKFKDDTQWEITPVSTSLYRLTKITNRTGQYLTLTWDASGRLQTVKNQANTTLLTYTYDVFGQLTQVADNNSRSVYFAHGTQATNGHPILAIVSQIVATGTVNPPAAASFGYADVQSRSLLNSITVPSPTGTGTSVTSIAYDTTGKTQSATDANGNKKVYTYNSGSTFIEVKDPANVTVYSYTQKYDSQRRNSGMIDAVGNSTLVEYTDPTNPYGATRYTDREGRLTQTSYDSFGNITSVISPRNVTTTLNYDYSVNPLGRLSSSQEGTLPATSYAYYANGLPQTITAPKPGGVAGTVTTTFTYDSLGNVLTVVSPGNNAGTTKTTTFNYTADGAFTQAAAVGQPLKVTDPNGKISHARYDAFGRVSSSWDALGNTTSYQYNLAGQPTVVTLPATGQTGSGNGRVENAYLWVGGPSSTTTIFNESNVQVRQSSVTLGKEGELLGQAGNQEPATYTYDAAYRLKTLKDGNNNQTTYAYNSRGWLSSVVLPGSDTWQYTSYSNEGSVLTRIDAKGVTTTFTYADPEGQLTAESYPATPTMNTGYSYDGYGRLQSRTDGEGSYSYTYGNLDEILTETTTYTGIAAKTLTYSYWDDGSLKNLVAPMGTFTMNYDIGGRPTSLLNPFAETTSWIWQDNNLLQRQTYQNGLKTIYGYNAQSQLTSLSNQNSASTVLSGFSSFTYDGAGNQLGVSVSVPSLTTYGGTHTYGYNTKDELTSAVSTRAGGFNQTFVNDAAGNLTTFKGTVKTHNSRNQLTGTGFVYDLNGNATTWRGTTATWDTENRLKTYGTYSAGYRADSLRAWRQIGTTKTYFLYAGGELLAEMNSTGAVTRTYTRGVNGLVSSRTGTTTQYYLFDERGNTVQRANATGALLSSHSTDAFGLTTNSVSPGTDPYAGHGGQWGYYWESTPALFYLHHRHYDPSVGRFLSRDPIGYAGGMNLYRYCENAPVGRLDPSGLDDDAWYDRLSAGAAREVETAKSFFIDSFGTAAWIPNTIMDFGTGIYHLPRSIMRFGSGLGAYAGDPSKPCNQIALWEDIGLACSMGLMGLTGAAGRAAPAAAEAPLAQVTINRANGLAAQEAFCTRLNARLSKHGYSAEINKTYYSTPLGKRMPDIVVRNAKGDIVRFVEVKSGMSRYTKIQRAKDAFLPHKTSVQRVRGKR